MKIYISGAIGSVVPVLDQGVPLEYRTPEDNYHPDFLRAKFHAADAFLTGKGHEVVNPLLTPACMEYPNGRCGTPVKPDDPRSHSWDCYMKHDIIDMMGCDGVFALNNWKRSTGAQIEVPLAEKLHMPIWIEISVPDGRILGYQFFNTQIGL